MVDFHSREKKPVLKPSVTMSPITGAQHGIQKVVEESSGKQLEQETNKQLEADKSTLKRKLKTTKQTD